MEPGYEGDPGAHVHGFLRAVIRAAEKCAPCVTVVVWEGERNWRKEAWPDYKAQRARSSGDPEIDALVDERRARFAESVRNLTRLISALGGRQAYPDDGEADDVLALLSRRFADRGRDVVIWTADHDLLQCVRERFDPSEHTMDLLRPPRAPLGGVSVITPGRAVLGGKPEDLVFATASDVIAKTGVPPNAIPDLKAIEGDSSDNIPGIPRLGHVAATKMLGRHRSLSALTLAAKMQVKHPHIVFEGTEKQRNLVIEHADSAALYRELCSLGERSRVLWVPPAPDRVEALRMIDVLHARAMARQGAMHSLKLVFGGS